MNLDLEKLGDLARAAKRGKKRKEWAWDGREKDPDGYVHIPECSWLVGGIQLTAHPEGYQRDCDFIAAASPWVVLELIRRIQVLEGER